MRGACGEELARQTEEEPHTDAAEEDGPGHGNGFQLVRTQAKHFPHRFPERDVVGYENRPAESEIGKAMRGYLFQVIKTVPLPGERRSSRKVEKTGYDRQPETVIQGSLARRHRPDLSSPAPEV